MGLASQALSDKSQRWWHLSSIQLSGGIISIPVIAVGAQVFLMNGLAGALLSIIIGNFILLLISYGIIRMSYKKRLNAVENTIRFIGIVGGRIFAFFILISMIGWLASDLFAGVSLLQIYPLFSKFTIGSLLGGIGSLALLMGIKGLRVMSIAAIIPLIILLVIIISIVNPSMTIYHPPIPVEITFFSLSAISLIISSNIAAVVDYPTFFRHSKSEKDSIIALSVIFIITSLAQISGILLVRMFIMDQSIIANLISENNVKSIMVVSFLIISMITSAAWNVYAASVGWESLFPRYKDKTEYAVIGLVATILLSNIQLEEMLVLVRTICDIIISGCGGMLIIGFIYQKKRSTLAQRQFMDNNLSWILGSIVGLAVYCNFWSSRDSSTFAGLLAGFFSGLIIAKIRNIHRGFRSIK